MSSNNQRDKIWETIVIGGGPSGMMAAATAAAKGVEVLLLEKNSELGKKLSISGGGRCNVTNNKPDVREMLGQYKDEGKFLFSTFTQHGVKDSVEWFLKKDVPFIEENEGRLFPETQSALTIRDTLVAEMKKSNVEVQSNDAVVSVSYDKDTQVFTVTTENCEYLCKKCVISTGGYARPDTGSTGDGFKWLESLGHEISESNKSLVPLSLKTKWTTKLSGISLQEAKISIWAYDKKQSTHVGRMLFTHFGVTGPLILNLSKEVGEFLDHTEVTLKLDGFPQFDAGELKNHIKEVLQSNKKLCNVLAEDLPLQLVKGVLGDLNIDPDTPCHSVSKEDRKSLLNNLKDIQLPVAGLLGEEKAVASAGGVSLEEIDFKTMESKLVPGLYVVGDVLNINRPSGGYSLQLCWSTGYVAGSNITLM